MNPMEAGTQLVIWISPILMALNLFACDRSHAVLPEAPAVSIAEATQSSDEQLQELLTLAASSDARDLRKLVDQLTSIEAIYRLDPRADHIRQPVGKLRLSRVHEAMRQNRSPRMRDALITLATSGKPANCDACDGLLIRTLAIVRPPTQEVIKFWERNSTEDSIHLDATVQALCDNSSVEAASLLERRLRDQSIAPEQKTAWMRRAILTNRHDPVLLSAMDRIVTTLMPKSLRPALVEALFDYRPADWYRADSTPPQPDQRPLTAEARRTLKKIGDAALSKVQLSQRQKAAVSKAMKQLN